MTATIAGMEKEKKEKKQLLLEQWGKSETDDIRPTARNYKKKSSKHRNFLKIAVGDHSQKTLWDLGVLGGGADVLKTDF